LLPSGCHVSSTLRKCNDYMGNHVHGSEPASCSLENCRHVKFLANGLLSAHSDISKKIQQALLCNSDDATRALVEVIKFIWLAANSSEGRLSPSHRVDLAWHELILFTLVYHEFCHEQFGRFVHHHPGGNHHENRQRLTLTERCYQETFGQPPQDFWGNLSVNFSSCGNCESE